VKTGRKGDFDHFRGTMTFHRTIAVLPSVIEMTTGSNIGIPAGTIRREGYRE
jgi:hypothetical protein